MDTEKLKRQNLIYKYLFLRGQKKIKELKKQVQKLKQPDAKTEEINEYLTKSR